MPTALLADWEGAASSQLSIGMEVQVSDASPTAALRGMVGEVVSLGEQVELRFAVLGVTVPVTKKAVGTHLAQGLLQILRQPPHSPW